MASNVENILQATIDGTTYEVPANSRVEELLIELKAVIEGGGGGGGTSDYTQLSNKPKINNVELSGNKTPSDLGVQPTIDSTHKIDADNVDDTNSTNKFTTAEQLTQIGNNKDAIDDQQNTTALGGNGYAIVNGIRLYIASSAPTGNIPDGSVGVGW